MPVSRRTFPAIVLVMFLLVFLGGCISLIFPDCFFTELETNTECEGFRLSGFCATPNIPLIYIAVYESTVLREVPSELEFVLVDRDKFNTTEHPLRNVTLGTVIGDSAELSGCWARVEDTVLADGSGQWVEAEFMTIDLDVRLVQETRMTAVDGHPCLDDPRPYIQLFDWQINTISDNELTLDGIGDTGARTTAGVNPDGTLSFHFLARFGWEISDGPEFRKLFTVDGNFLATSKNRGENPLEEADLWLRVDCAEVELVGQ